MLKGSVVFNYGTQLYRKPPTLLLLHDRVIFMMSQINKFLILMYSVKYKLDDVIE